MKDDEFLTAEQVADLLKLSRAYVYRLIRVGELPALHFGKSVRVRRTGLVWYLHEKAPASLARTVLKLLEE